MASYWRISLFQAFQGVKLRQSIELICADSDALAPSFKEADRSFMVIL